MTHMMEESGLDPDLADWVMPDEDEFEGSRRRVTEALDRGLDEYFRRVGEELARTGDPDAAVNAPFPQWMWDVTVPQALGSASIDGWRAADRYLVERGICTTATQGLPAHEMTAVLGSPWEFLRNAAVDAGRHVSDSGRKLGDFMAGTSQQLSAFGERFEGRVREAMRPVAEFLLGSGQATGAWVSDQLRELGRFAAQAYRDLVSFMETRLRWFAGWLRRLWNDLSGLKFLYVATIDRRTCDVCRALHGMVFGWDQLWEMLPPMHFWCRCRLIVLTPEDVRALNAAGLAI